jgi:single-stranded DNA-binding protein
MLPIISGEFGVVQEPELRFNDDGRAWAKLRGVAKDRRKNAAGEWEDGDATAVTGKLKQREWQSDGKTMKAYSILADNVGVSIRFTSAATPKYQQNMKNTPAAQESSDSGSWGKEEAPF